MEEEDADYRREYAPIGRNEDDEDNFAKVAIRFVKRLFLKACMIGVYSS